ncbi:hypothetical protein RP20_CCG016113 [Aedes albopictus]|nr:hypothetical protein RP20_CCG016113 [Aedes albopictus]
MADMPDLSHLTQEERAIIENVMLRQRQEEERENEIMRRKQDEVATLVDSIRQKSEQQKKAGVELDATCHICLKTKFADGIGHICNYCNIRCCAKCGGKVTLRNNKVIWVCIVCRKKQELLSKTGQWINKSTSPDGTPGRRYEGDPRGYPQTLDPHDPSDKRPKLERAKSAAEKENNPMQRSGSQLRRQYSQQDPPQRRLSQSDSGVDISTGPSQVRLPMPRMHSQGGQQQGPYGQYTQHPGLPQPPLQQSPYGHPQSHMNPQVQITRPSKNVGMCGYAQEDPSYYQGEIEDLMRAHPHLVHPRQQQHYAESMQSGSSSGIVLPPEPMKKHKRPMGGPYLPQQRSYSSSDEDIRSTPEYEGTFEIPEQFPKNQIKESLNELVEESRKKLLYEILEEPRQASLMGKEFLMNSLQKFPKEFQEESMNNFMEGHSFWIFPKELQQRSLKEFQQECLINPRRNHSKKSSRKPQMNWRRNLHKESSKELQKKPPKELQEESPMDFRKEFPKEKLQKLSSLIKSSVGNEQPDPYWDDPADSRRFTERRKKTVRFDGQDADDWGRWESERQGSQDSTTKDSGIDTSSTFTSSEDSNRGDGPKNPVSWQVSADGSRMIGHMVLQRNVDSEDVLGLRVRGGQVLPHNEKGAIVEQVQRGSIADQEGHIRPGDEVVEWNGHSMRGKSASDVYDIISASRREPLVELLLTREIAINRKNTQASWRKSHSPTRIQTHRGAENYNRRDKPSVLVTSPGSPDLHSVRNYSTNLRYPNRLTPAATATQQENCVGGRIQLKLGFDLSSLQLIVTIVGAKDLVPRLNGAARNPYAKYSVLGRKPKENPRIQAGTGSKELGTDKVTKYSGSAKLFPVDETRQASHICLLPDRSEKSKRRTKTLALTNEPRWGQTFVYEGLRRADLQNRLFEVLSQTYSPVIVYICYKAVRSFQITVWDYVRYGANDFLGEVILDLSTYPLDDEAEWHVLQPHSESLRDAFRREDREPGNELDMILSPIDHLSPPSTTSRCTDSDTTSECDIDGLMTARDGASVSSSSPPPEVDLQERRSRRDMSPQGRKRVASMVAKDYRTVSGVGQGFHNQMTNEASASYRRNGTMALNQRSQSAAPSDSYRDDRRDSLSPQDDRYTEYPVLPLHQYAPRFQSRSATATPTGSPKKRQLPQVPHVSRNAAMRERFVQEFEERSGGRFSRYRHRQSHHLPTYRSTGMGGWEQRYTGLSDSDLTTHSLDSRIRPRHSLSPDKDFMGDFADSDMESVVSVTSSAFSTQSERPRGSKGIRNTRGRRLQHRSLPSGWATTSLCALPSEYPFGQPVSEAEHETTLPDVAQAGLNPPNFDVAPDQGFIPSSEYIPKLPETPMLPPMASTSSVVVPSATEDNRLVPSPAVPTLEQFPLPEPASNSYFSKQCIMLNSDQSTIQSCIVNPGNDNMMTTSLNLSNMSSTEPTSLELKTGSLPLSSYMQYGINQMSTSLQGDSFYNDQASAGYDTNRRPSYAARSNTSEPNLNSINKVRRRMPKEPRNSRNESICVSNHRGPHTNQSFPTATNQIILKSSFSDQNLPNSFTYEQNSGQTGNICISNVYDPNTGIKNQTITCIRNSMENLGESNIRYSSTHDGSICEFSAPHLQFRSSVGSIDLNVPPRMIAKKSHDIRQEDEYHVDDFENDLGVVLRKPTEYLTYPREQPFYGHTELGFKETYLGNTITKQKDKFNRSQSLVASDHMIDIEYDSDAGYKTKSVRKNMIASSVEEKVYHKRTRSLDGHKALDEKYTDNNSDSIGSRSSLDKSNMTLDIIRNTDASHADSKDNANNRKTNRKSTASPAKKNSKMSKNTSSSNSLNRSGSAKSKASSSKGSTTKSKAADKPKFKEVDPVLQKSNKQRTDSKNRVDEIKGEIDVLHSSSESIKSIIDEVRHELLQKPQNFTYLSDESPTFLNRSHSLSDGDSTHNRRINEKYDKYEFIEGRKHYILKDDNLNRKVDLGKYENEKAVGYSRSHSVDNRRGHSTKASGDMFTKCRTRSSSVVSNDEDRCDENEDYVSDDDVFESPFSRGRNSSFNGKSSTKRRSRLDTRRTSSLEDLKKFASQHKAGSSNKGSKSDNTRHSSVSINDKPEYFEYSKSPSPRPKTDARNANYASNRSKSSNGIALLQTEPKRTSLKKTSPGGPTPRKSNPHQHHHHQSDYDVRDRGRYGNNGGRDAYRQRDRDRNSSDHERDRLSDGRRESRERAELDRSLSNNEGTPEDKIDGSLSDTAVIQSLDSRRKLDQRSPKSETPTRERDLFGPGMGKKSSSTSQLSATGRKRRMGFGKRGKNSFTVHRSEEVLPGEVRGGLSRGSSASSDGEGSADGDRPRDIAIILVVYIATQTILSGIDPTVSRSDTDSITVGGQSCRKFTLNL